MTELSFEARMIAMETVFELERLRTCHRVPCSGNHSSYYLRALEYSTQEDGSYSIGEEVEFWKRFTKLCDDSGCKSALTARDHTFSTWDQMRALFKKYNPNHTWLDRDDEGDV